MGKLTFRRVVSVRLRTLLISSLPIAGGTLFFVGSFCFWPGSTELTINAGALCFLVGSLCYWSAPFLDFWELTHNYGNLLEPPPDASVALSSQDTYRMAALYEHLYKSHILRIQCANCLVYMLGGGFFVAGSTLFFPTMAEIIYHGGWLYITGCVLTLAGALLAMLTAFEMKRTAMPMRFIRPPPALMLPFWTDEGATIASCSLYVGGNLVFITGSVRGVTATPCTQITISASLPSQLTWWPCPAQVCFFPRVIAIGGVLIEMLAVLLFIFGSILFTLGAIIDLIVIMRAPRLVRAPSAPQLRGLSLGRWPARRSSLASKPPGAARAPTATPLRKYHVMAEESEGSRTPATTDAVAEKREVEMAGRRPGSEATVGAAEQLAAEPAEQRSPEPEAGQTRPQTSVSVSSEPPPEEVSQV